MTRSLTLPTWPRGADVAVSLTFDVDAEAGYTGEGEKYADQLVTLSEGTYGIARGLPRLLALLKELDIRGTFYVPGETAERHSEVLKRLLEDGHEIGHHGHRHLRPHHVDAAMQREELERGTEALERHLGVRPRGYRSPAWEVTRETFALLLELGFDWDTSFMGDDRPYVEEYDGGSIVELPVHWSLDDWPYFGWHPDFGGTLGSPTIWSDVWHGEFASALEERRHVTYTMHPEIIGRGYRLPALRGFLERIASEADVAFMRHDELFAAVTAVNPG